jgi:hypothetical protein
VSKFIEVVRDAILFHLWFLFCWLPYFLIFLGVHVPFLLITYFVLDEIPINNVDNYCCSGCYSFFSSVNIFNLRLCFITFRFVVRNVPTKI